MKKEVKTLVIHPFDRSTFFLGNMYESIKDKRVITNGASKDEIRELLKESSKIILCGHGSPNGLFSVGQFGPDTRGYIIDESMVEVLRGKKLITIWCHANLFIVRHKLKAFTSSMFSSEYSECEYEGIKGVKRGMVEESNNAFASIVGSHINSSLKSLHKSVIQEYGVLGEVNPVAAYNNARLLLF